MIEKIMYRVEKFELSQCPHCQHPLYKQGEDWNLFLGWIEKGEKKYCTEPFQVLCCGCNERFTHRCLEWYQVGDKAFAEDLLTKGFINLIEVTAVGNHTQDMHGVHKGDPLIEIIKCEE